MVVFISHLWSSSKFDGSMKTTIGERVAPIHGEARHILAGDPEHLITPRETARLDRMAAPKSNEPIEASELLESHVRRPSGSRNSRQPSRG